MNREKAFQEWADKKGQEFIDCQSAGCGLDVIEVGESAFTAALDLMEKEIAGVKRMAQTMLECEADTTERAENQVTRHLAEVVKIHEAEIERLKAQNKRLAVGMLATRDEIIAGDYDAAYHELYRTADPKFEEMREPWKWLEDIVTPPESEEEQITLKESMIEVLAVDAATLNAALIDIINGKMEKQSAILLPDYEAYDSDEKKREWAKAEALKRLEVTDEGY